MPEIERKLKEGLTDAANAVPATANGTDQGSEPAELEDGAGADKKSGLAPAETLKRQASLDTQTCKAAIATSPCNAEN